MQLPHKFHWIFHRLCVLLWKVCDNCTVHICVNHWVNASINSWEVLLKFFCPLQRGHYHDLQDATGRRILEMWHSYWPSTVYKSDTCRLLCTFIRHETHWVQNLRGFQLMNKSQLNLCWLRIGLRLKRSSPCLGRLCLIAIPSEKSLF